MRRRRIEACPCAQSAATTERRMPPLPLPPQQKYCYDTDGLTLNDVPASERGVNNTGRRRAAAAAA